MLTPEECPAGDICPVHHRIDMMSDTEDYFSAITYVGEYAVFTDDNPLADFIGVLQAKMLGEPMPDAFATDVYRVGKDGSLYNAYDFAKKVMGGLRFRQTHNDRDNVSNAHLMIVESVKNELIDLSKDIQA